MRRLLLVANPAASGFTASLHRDVVEILERGFHVTAIWPNGPAQARTESAAAAADGFDVVVAMGGDGVVHEVANAIIGASAALGIIPAGTSNVLRRIVGFPRKPRDAAEYLANATGTRAVPSLRVTEGIGDSARDHIATFAAGIGFDAEVIKESERRPLGKIGFGTLHYARSTTRVARTFRDRLPTLRVTDGTSTADAVAVLTQVHDHFTYLGRVPLALGSGPRPIAAVISRVTTPRLFYLLARAGAKRELARVPGVEIWEGFERLEVTSEPSSWIEADGEILGRASSVTIRPEPRPLLIVSR
ncbi:MAG: diacylglycerol kinase family protein [Acidimicrobiia bacterium]